MRARGAQVFAYIWSLSAPVKSDASWEWVPLKKITKKFVPYRGCGNALIREDPEIQHYNQLLRVLKDLVEIELLDVKQEIIPRESNPNKKQKNTFYKISDQSSYAEAVTPEEKNNELLEELNYLRRCRYQDCDDLSIACELLEDLGIVDPFKEIDRYREEREAENEAWRNERIRSRKKKN